VPWLREILRALWLDQRQIKVSVQWVAAKPVVSRDQLFRTVCKLGAAVSALEPNGTY
jgi:hypothetical protein